MYIFISVTRIQNLNNYNRHYFLTKKYIKSYKPYVQTQLLTKKYIYKNTKKNEDVKKKCFKIDAKEIHMK